MKAIVAVMAVLACVLLLRRAGYLPWFELPKKKKGIPGLSISLECEVQDRATLVRAFELLSLRVLGDDAATWHHRAIGAALAQRTASGEAAAAAARLYELARYAPPAEPWTDATTAEARRYLALLRAGRP